MYYRLNILNTCKHSVYAALRNKGLFYEYMKLIVNHSPDKNLNAYVVLCYFKACVFNKKYIYTFTRLIFK